jgi:hypothetical protein
MDKIVNYICFASMLYFFYAVTALPILLGTWFLGRRKVNWLKVEFAFPLIPCTAWVFLMFFDSTGKSFSNIIEVFYCGIPGGMILLPRFFFSASSKKKKLLITSLSTLLATIIAILIYSFTPGLPE